MAPSRSRELLADAGSVELTKNPDAMISALRMIDNRGELRGGDLGRHGDVHRQSARRLRRPVFDPSSVDARVSALVKFARGHNPGPLAYVPAKWNPVRRQEHAPKVNLQRFPTPLPTKPPKPGSPLHRHRQSTPHRRHPVHGAMPNPAGTPQGPWGKPAGPWDHG
jgi:heat shock protein HtpX